MKMCKSMMEMMSKVGIKADDHKHVELFDEYMRMRKDGIKVSYIEAVLAEKHRVSPRTISRIVCRFKRHVKI